MFNEIEKKRSIIATLKAETNFFLFVERVGLELLPVSIACSLIYKGELSSHHFWFVVTAAGYLLFLYTVLRHLKPHLYNLLAENEKKKKTKMPLHPIRDLRIYCHRMELLSKLPFTAEDFYNLGIYTRMDLIYFLATYIYLVKGWYTDMDLFHLARYTNTVGMGSKDMFHVTESFKKYLEALYRKYNITLDEVFGRFLTFGHIKVTSFDDEKVNKMIAIQWDQMVSRGYERMWDISPAADEDAELFTYVNPIVSYKRCQAWDERINADLYKKLESIVQERKEQKAKEALDAEIQRISMEMCKK